MEPKPMLSSGQAAKYLGLPVHTLVTLRKRGAGPTWVDIGTGPQPVPRYQVDKLDEWLAARTVTASE